MTNEITRKNFDEKYFKEGGVERLLEMYNSGSSTSDIGKVFKLENKAVNYYLKRIIGEKYYRFPFRKGLSDLDLSPLHIPKDD